MEGAQTINFHIKASPRAALGISAAAAARRFAAASEGTTAIEVALLGMPFFMLLVGILVTGFMTWSNSVLDYATQRASRQVMTGALQAANTTASQFKLNVLCSYLPSPPFDCTKLVVNLKMVTESAEPTGWYGFVKPDYSAIAQPALSSTSNTFCLGGGNAYQVLEVLYPFPIYARFVATPTALANGQFVVMSTAAFKNEPFQGPAQGAC